MAVVRRKIIAYCRAAQKAADWLESRQQASGVVDPENGVGEVYKTTAAFVAAGRLHAAWKLMDYIGAPYVVEQGGPQSEPPRFAALVTQLDAAFGKFRWQLFSRQGK